MDSVGYVFVKENSVPVVLVFEIVQLTDGVGGVKFPPEYVLPNEMPETKRQLEKHGFMVITEVEELGTITTAFPVGWSRAVVLDDFDRACGVQLALMGELPK